MPMIRGTGYRLPKHKKKKLVIALQYDAHEVWKNFLHYKGTAFQMVLPEWRIYVFMSLYTLLFVVINLVDEARAEEFHDWWAISLADMAPLTGLVMFVIVFYNSQCFGTYRDLYNHGNTMSGSIQDLAMRVKGLVKIGTMRWDLLRHLLAAQRVFYYELQKDEAENHGIQAGENGHPGSWQQFAGVCQAKALLTREELDCVDTYKGEKTKLLLSWSELTIQNALKTNSQSGLYNQLTPDEKAVWLRLFMDEIADIRVAINGTRSGMQLTVPFAYHHIVKIMVNTYLLFLAFAFIGRSEDAISYLKFGLYFTIAFLLFGLQGVADSMADPFGDDKCDFNVHAWIENLHAECMHLCFSNDAAICRKLGVDLVNQAHHLGATAQAIMQAENGLPTRPEGFRPESAISQLQLPPLPSVPPIQGMSPNGSVDHGIGGQMGFVNGATVHSIPPIAKTLFQ